MRIRREAQKKKETAGNSRNWKEKVWDANTKTER